MISPEPEDFGFAPACCAGRAIDGVHDASCHTTDGVYRCVECDFTFTRTDNAIRSCPMCRLPQCPVAVGFDTNGDDAEIETCGNVLPCKEHP